MKTLTRTLGLCLLLVISLSTFARPVKPICPSTQDIMNRLGNDNIMSFKRLPNLDVKYYGELEITDNFNTNTKWYFFGGVYPHPKLIPSVDVAWDLFRQHMNSHIDYRPDARYIEWGSFWMCGYGPTPYYDERDDVNGIMYYEFVSDIPFWN